MSVGVFYRKAENLAVQIAPLEWFLHVEVFWQV